MTISMYSFEDKDGEESGCFTTLNFRDAEEYARKYNLRIIENVFEWSEAIPVEGGDYTNTPEDEGR